MRRSHNHNIIKNYFTFFITKNIFQIIYKEINRKYLDINKILKVFLRLNF